MAQSVVVSVTSQASLKSAVSHIASLRDSAQVTITGDAALVQSAVSQIVRQRSVSSAVLTLRGTTPVK